MAGAADLRAAVGGLADAAFLDDVERGLQEAPMNVRVSPYLLSLIDWSDPYADPIRIQFLPTASTRRPDHPRLALDSLHEQDDSPTPGLVHRYPDKALFLPLDVCPVYCRFCTRSYAIGGDTDAVEKEGFKPRTADWEAAFAYIASRPEIEDIVVSGGGRLHAAGAAPARDRRHAAGRSARAAHPHGQQGPRGDAHEAAARRGLDRRPDRPLRHGVASWARRSVCTPTSTRPARSPTTPRQAMDLLFRRGLKVRNQSVLIRGVNDDPDEMVNLVKQLSWMNVQPYYVYQHDMVKGVEDLRTRLEDTMEIERFVRGSTAGFNTPTFVTDVPGGGGKRDLHSFDFYDEVTGRGRLPQPRRRRGQVLPVLRTRCTCFPKRGAAAGRIPPSTTA